MEQLLWFALGCGTVLVSVPLLIPLTRRLGLVDIPGGRRRHSLPTPKAGGVAFGLTILVAGLLAWALFDSAPPWGLWIGSLLLLALGLLDDLRPIPAFWRLAGQTLAGLCMTRIDNLQLQGFGDLLGSGTIDFGLYAEAITVFAVVGGINCINMIDGADGLSGGVALIAVLGVLLIAGAGSAALNMPALLLAGMLLGFLWYNHPWLKGRRQLVFLGEAGTNLLGFWLAWLLVAAAERGEQAFPPMAAVWLMLVPLADTLSLMVRRSLRGRSPCSSDREHVHHLLTRWLGSERAAVWRLLALSTGGAIVAFGTAQAWWSEPVSFYVFMVILMGYTALTWRRSLPRDAMSHPPIAVEDSSKIA